jgi:hypothetical protein
MSMSSTGHSRHERGISASIPDDCVVMTLVQCAQAANISVWTLRRRIADGTGPIMTKMSERRFGVTLRHHREWLDRQALPPA